MSKLDLVHPDLVKLWQDFAAKFSAGFEPVLLETVRTPERQAQLVKAGASKTMNSRHLLHNGYCHAIDIGADVQLGPGTEIRWDWPLYIQIAEGMRASSRRTGVPVIWGGVWDTELALLQMPMEVELQEYQRRHLKRWLATNPGKRYPGAFIDGPHYELPWSKYP